MEREKRFPNTPREVRLRHKKLRQKMAQYEVTEASESICHKLYEASWYQDCTWVYGYYPLENEVDCRQFLEKALSDGKRVALPRMAQEASFVEVCHMEFYEITSLEQVAKGGFGVLEPLEICPLIQEKEAVVLVPGVAFDGQGNRYGYGRGYYDRYFARYPKLYKVALAYQNQIEETLEVSETDVKMDCVYTEQQSYLFAERTGRYMELLEICKKAKEVSRQVGNLDTNTKNNALLAVADALVAHADDIISANERDLAHGRENHMPEGMLDRLMLNHSRIEQIAEGVRQVAELEDPIGEVLSMKKRPNGLMIGKKRVPLGVVGMIYEARPNVTVDAFGLCFKTGNAVILKGGSDAIHSNIAIVSVIQNALKKQGIPQETVLLIEDTSRETATAFMKMNDYVDVLIPRGGAGLIKTVVNQATIPVIETGTGNCHIFVDETADFAMAIDIIRNAKTQRISVCNACESLVIHEKIVDAFMPQLVRALQEKDVEMHADERCMHAVLSGEDEGESSVRKELLKVATEEDWGTEYLDYVISAKTVASVDEAIAHINRYNTGHSEAIITNNYEHAEKFLNEIDAACVYINASTRFSDGFEFGFGAEIGISTQKLHARGPMGLEALTSTKYIIYGNGQVRA